jgi:hypothetical protein
VTPSGRRRVVAHVGMLKYWFAIDGKRWSGEAVAMPQRTLEARRGLVQVRLRPTGPVTFS